MSTDLADRLPALRPAPQFPASDRDAMLDAILSTERSTAQPSATIVAMRSTRRRRVLAAAAVIGLAAAVAVAVPALVPSQAPGGATPAAAAALHRLAIVIRHHRSAGLGPDQYRYVDQTSTQTGTCCDSAGKAFGALTEQSSSWTDQHGNVWRRDEGNDTTGKHYVDTSYFPAHADSSESPDVLASYPTDPNELRDYLRSHAIGSDSVDEAVFVAIKEQILQEGIAPSELRAAAVQVLAETDHVSLTRNTHDAAGRSAERFDFSDKTDSNRPDEVQSIYFDPDTAQVFETSTIAPGSTDIEIVRHARVTGSVPAAIRRAAKTRK